MAKKSITYTILRRVVTFVVIIITSSFFIRTLVRNWEEVKEIGIRINLYSLVITLLFAGAVGISGLLWGKVISKLDQKSSKTISNIEFIKIHIGSWLLKYIPGQVGSFLGKVKWGSSKGFSKKTVSVSFLYENIFLMLASLILSLPLAFISAQNIGDNLARFSPLLIIFPFLLIFNKNLFYKLLNFILTTLKRDNISTNYFFNFKDLLYFLILYILPRIINAAGFVLLAVSLFNITSSNFILFGSAYVLAGLLGLLAILVPSGIGVREAIIVIFLTSTIGTASAVLLSIYARFYSTIADIVLLLIYIIIDKLNIKKLK